LIKLSRVISALDRHVDHVLVHSGQNHDPQLKDVFFADLEIRAPDHMLDVAGGSAAATIGLVIARFDDVLVAERPDAVLIYGDTNTGLGAIPAKRRRIPVFHMEAGNRSFDARVPEEVNRKIIDHISDVNMTNSEHARRYLLSEGLHPDAVIKTGSPMREVLDHYRPRIESSTILADLGIRAGEYIVVSAHREENVDDAALLTRLLRSLEALLARFDVPVIVSTHPRTKRRLADLGLTVEGGDVRFLEPFGFLDYVRLQLDAKCVVSDSGTLTEEAVLLGFPAVMIREAHERPEGNDVGAIVFTTITPDAVVSAVELVVAEDRPEGAVRVPDYDANDVSGAVVRIIVSYVQYLRRTVWYGAPPVFD
jgi:UDP-N-acetylglucosamine 2-epimerase